MKKHFENIMMVDKTQGWIKIFLSIRDHWIWNDAEYLLWWVDILSEVHHTTKDILIKRKIYEVKRGYSGRSQRGWSRRWDVNIGRVNTFFEILEKEKMILLDPSKNTTFLTVCNYDKYQNKKSNDIKNNDKIDKSVRIIFYRSLRNKPIWNLEFPQRLKWFLDILFEATLNKESPGTIIKSYGDWAARWMCKDSEVKSFIKSLKLKQLVSLNENKINTEDNNTKITQLTICNYESYIDEH